MKRQLILSMLHLLVAILDVNTLTDIITLFIKKKKETAIGYFWLLLERLRTAWRLMDDGPLSVRVVSLSRDILGISSFLGVWPQNPSIRQCASFGSSPGGVLALDL